MSEIPESKGIELPDIAILNEEEVILFADTALVEAGNSLTRRGEGINQICELIFKMEDPVRQSVFIAAVSQRHKITKKVITDRLKALKDSLTVIQEDEKDPFEGFDGIDKFSARKLGFFEHRNCIYFLTKEGPFRGANFII